MRNRRLVLALAPALLLSYVLPFWRYEEGEYGLSLSGFAYMVQQHAYLSLILLLCLGLALIYRRRDLTYFGGFMWLYSMLFLVSPSFAMDRDLIALMAQFQTLSPFLAYGYYLAFVIGLVFWLALLASYQEASLEARDPS